VDVSQAGIWYVSQSSLCDAPYSRLMEMYIDQGGGGATTGLISEDEFLNPAMIAAANEGHWETARELLRRFVEDGPGRSPLLVTYVAERVKDWLGMEFDASGARSAFLIAAPVKRPISSDANARQVRAIELYLLSRGKGRPRERAIIDAARDPKVARAPKTVEKYLSGLHARDGEFSCEQVQAIGLLKLAPSMPKYRGPAIDDAFLSKALGASWARWEAREARRWAVLAKLAKNRPRQPA
jgi:hypothetical protein